MIQFIETFREDFNSFPAEDIAFPRGVNGIYKYTNGGHLYKAYAYSCEGVYYIQ